MPGFWSTSCLPLAATLDAPAKKNWKTGPLGCFGDCNSLDSTQCKILACYSASPACQAGLNNKALGGNFFMGCCLGGCAMTAPCLAVQQRAKVRADNKLDGNIVEDVILGCCCPGCTFMQVGNQLGDSATFTAGGLKIEDLMAPPTKEEMKASVAVPATSA